MYGGRTSEPRFDTRKEKDADDREFAENRSRLDAAGEHKMNPAYGTRSEEHPGRKVHRERFGTQPFGEGLY